MAIRRTNYADHRQPHQQDAGPLRRPRLHPGASHSRVGSRRLPAPDGIPSDSITRARTIAESYPPRKITIILPWPLASTLLLSAGRRAAGAPASIGRNRRDSNLFVLATISRELP